MISPNSLTIFSVLVWVSFLLLLFSLFLWYLDLFLLKNKTIFIAAISVPLGFQLSDKTFSVLVFDLMHEYWLQISENQSPR